MLRWWTRAQSRLAVDAHGASMVEYAFLIGLIAMAVIAAAVVLGNELNSDFNEVGSTVVAN